MNEGGSFEINKKKKKIVWRWFYKNIANFWFMQDMVAAHIHLHAYVLTVVSSSFPIDYVRVHENEPHLDSWATLLLEYRYELLQSYFSNWSLNNLRQLHVPVEVLETHGHLNKIFNHIVQPHINAAIPIRYVKNLFYYECLDHLASPKTCPRCIYIRRCLRSGPNPKVAFITKESFWTWCDTLIVSYQYQNDSPVTYLMCHVNFKTTPCYRSFIEIHGTF